MGSLALAMGYRTHSLSCSSQHNLGGRHATGPGAKAAVDIMAAVRQRSSDGPMRKRIGTDGTKPRTFSSGHEAYSRAQLSL